MRYPLLRFVFDRKRVSSRTRKGLVQIEVTSERRRKWIGTSVKVYSDQWDDRWKVVNHEDSMRLNETLDAMIGDIRDYVNSLMRKNEPFTFEGLDRFLESGKGDTSFIGFVEGRICGRGDIRESTRRQHMTLLGSLREFGRIRDIGDLTPANITLYDDFLHSRGYGQGTVHNYHKRLKRYINEAIRFGLLQRSPYAGMTIDRGENTERRYLTDEELALMRDMDVGSESLSNVRDLFLFQCYTGLSYSDMAALDAGRDIVERDGRRVIAGKRNKTGEDYYIVLLSPAIEILERHGWRLPVISNQKYNITLKGLAARAGIWKNVTSHVARHTFAVFALNHGVPMEVVSKMLGHTDIRTTQIYAKVLNREVERGFDRLEDFLGKDNG